MQQSEQAFKDLGLRVVGLSYDSKEILADFSERHAITFPLLSDPESQALQKLGLVNPEGQGMSQGVAFPGVIYLDQDGKVRESFFEDSYRDRPTPGTLLARLFPELKSERGMEPGQDFSLGQTGREGVVGSQWELEVTFDLPEGSHLYAPGSVNYQALSLEMEAHPWFEFSPPRYPASETQYLQAVDEEVPVFSKRVTLRLPVKVKASDETMALQSPQATTLRGKLKYQICTESTCYMPSEKPVEWQVRVKPLDRQRVPEESQHQK